MKQTLINWYKENKTLASIIIGAIGFPLSLFLVGVVIALIIAVLSLIFGEFGGVAVFLAAGVGAFGGWIWSREN